MPRAISPTRAFDLAAAAAFAAVALLLVAVAGQPLFTDDTWWHLALGEAYARQGPWLAGDPLLFAAPGPPAPAAWLADTALYSLWRVAGFGGLRAAHVAAVAAALTLAASLLRRASGSLAVASLGALCFAALAAYRLAQLRPELATILATLALYRLLVEGGAPPTYRRVVASALLFALWANCHAGFVLGLLLLASALAALVLAMPLRPALRAADRSRASRLALALGLGALAALVNPTGVGAYLAAFGGGGVSELSRVADEWARLEPFRLPVPQLPPSPQAFGLAWALLVLTPLAALAAVRRAGAAHAPARAADPALVGWALASLLAPLAAVRFLWLGLFPLLLLAGSLPARRTARTAALAAGAAWLLVPGFVRFGDWPMISAGLPRTLADYGRPYAAAKYPAQAIAFLVDAGLEGNVFADYHVGGFLGFFGAPSLRTLLNGSLNVSRETLEANRAIRERRGARTGEEFTALLDRLGIDLFLGTRLPQVFASQRPLAYTTAHLERTDGWLCVFRNLDSAVYLRVSERNGENLARVVAWYERQRVPFDAQRGCQTERAIREAPAWSVAQGVVPVHLEGLRAALRADDPATRVAARDQLASLYAALSLYERAERLDRRSLRADPSAPGASRRLVWSLLRQGRTAEAQEQARARGAAARVDWLLREIAAAAERVAASDAETAASIVARLPVLTQPEAQLAGSGIVPPEPRPRATAPRSRARAAD